jgi:hypothetical protein
MRPIGFVLLAAMAGCAVPPLPPVYQDAEAHCAQYNATPEIHQYCLGSVAIGNEIRAEARSQYIAGQDDPPPAPIPVFTPTPMAPATLTMPPAPPTAMPVSDICSVMSCPRPAPPPVHWIPYTPGGGNPGGYGLLAQ